MITIFQSAPAQQPLWQSQCLSSVREWCAQQGYRYQFLGDELFDRVPNLESEGGTALWLDADTLVVDASWAPNTEVSVCFGEEYWLDTDSRGRLKVFKQPHNAFMLFAADNTVLPFLHQVAHSIIERADSAAISPQMIGPKLLKALHSLADFPLCPEAGALSPVLASELVHGCGPAIDAVRESHRPKTCLWNLCGSLAGEERHESNLLALTHDLSLFESLS